jgi:peptide/nickel transport system substrate-binding protein
MRAVGIEVQLVPKRSFGEVVAAARAREGDMFIYNWHVAAPFPERLLRPLFHSQAIPATNLTHYRSSVVDKLLDDGARLPEGPEQQRLYSDVQKRITEDVPMAFLFHWTRMAAHAKRVLGLEPRIDVLPYDKLANVDLAP